MRRQWTPEEDEYLRQNWGTMRQRDIALHLGRTLKAVKRRGYVMGLTKQPERRWTPEEDEYLRRNCDMLSSKEMALNLRRSCDAVRGRCSAMGLKVRPKQPIQQQGDICLVPLHSRKFKGMHAIIDVADYDLVSPYRWHIVMSGRIFYALADSCNGKCVQAVLMHCLIINAKGVDHKDHNGLNNRRSNLRLSSLSQNRANSRKHEKHTSSRFKGVYWNKQDRRWCASIKNNHKRVFLGYFSDEETAAKAYDKAAFQAWGEFACLNFPEDYPEHDAAVTNQVLVS